MSKYQLDALNSAPLLVRFQLFQTQHLTRGQTFLQNSRPAKRHEAIAGLQAAPCESETALPQRFPPCTGWRTPCCTWFLEMWSLRIWAETTWREILQAWLAGMSKREVSSAFSICTVPLLNASEKLTRWSCTSPQRKTHTHMVQDIFSIFNAWNQGEKPTLFQRIHHVVAGAQKWPLSALNCGTACLE